MTRAGSILTRGPPSADGTAVWGLLSSETAAETPSRGRDRQGSPLGAPRRASRAVIVCAAPPDRPDLLSTMSDRTVAPPAAHPTTSLLRHRTRCYLPRRVALVHILQQSVTVAMLARCSPAKAEEALDALASVIVHAHGTRRPDLRALRLLSRAIAITLAAATPSATGGGTSLATSCQGTTAEPASPRGIGRRLRMVGERHGKTASRTSVSGEIRRDLVGRPGTRCEIAGTPRSRAGRRAMGSEAATIGIVRFEPELRQALLTRNAVTIERLRQ